MDWSYKKCDILFSPDLLLENWSEVLQKVKEAVSLWYETNFFLKGKTDEEVSNIYTLIFTKYPLTSIKFAELERACYSSEGIHGMTNISALWLHFLDWMCIQYDEKN